MDSHAYDALGGELSLSSRNTKVWLTTQEASFGERRAIPQAHILDAPACVSLATDLLSRAAGIVGAANLPADVLAALGALRMFADRDEAERVLGLAVMGETA